MKPENLKTQESLNHDFRGLFIALKDKRVKTDGIDTTKTILQSEYHNLFSWQEVHNGTHFHVTGNVKELLPNEVAQQIIDSLSNSALVDTYEVLKSLDKTSEDTKSLTTPENYNSSWYWPMDKRLPRKDYKNPEPIIIAQADTGISMQANVVGGFNPKESMSFFPNEGKGKGVICWGNDHPFFIGHGTSTGGLMVGQPAEDLELHGMTYRDVVQLLPCRVANSVVLVPQDVMRLTECIHWAVDQKVKVINISLGIIAADYDPVLRPLTVAIERAYKNGVIVCCASGQIAPGMVWPAIYAMKGWAICCAPSNQNKEPSPQSVWPLFANGYVNIAAPGEYMPQATWKDGICATNIAEIGSSEGSSYSTAYTSSLAALWWALNYSTLIKKDPRDIVPLFRNMIAKSCSSWNGDYPKNYGPGILNPNKILKPLIDLEDYAAECSGAFKIKKVPGGTYKNVKLHAHSSGSIHVIDPVFVEGKLTLISESSATISMSGTIICRELEIICKNSATINGDDLEYYDSCKLDIAVSSTVALYIAAEGPMSGSVRESYFATGSTLNAWIFWRHGKKSISIHKDNWCTVNLHNWTGKWA